MDSRIPEYAQKELKKLVAQEWTDYRKFDGLGYSGLTDADHYAQGFETCWEYEGFSSREEARYAYRDYITALRIRKWFRGNNITTRKGTVQTFDGRRAYATGLWNIVRSSGLDTECDGVKWSVRKVDGLKNVYVWFK